MRRAVLVDRLGPVTRRVGRISMFHTHPRVSAVADVPLPMASMADVPSRLAIGASTWSKHVQYR